MRDKFRRFLLRTGVGIAAGVCALVFAPNCWADPAMPTLFSDHMVLQRGREIHIWGNADAGEKISVSLAGHNANATADDAGKWSVRFRRYPQVGRLRW